MDENGGYLSEDSDEVPLPVRKYRKGMPGIFEHVPGLRWATKYLKTLVMSVQGFEVGAFEHQNCSFRIMETSQH